MSYELAKQYAEFQTPDVSGYSKAFLKMMLFAQTVKLTNSDVYSLLRNAYDIEEMARILGKENIDKLSGNTVLGLLRYASNKKKMAEILGSDNINKLSDENVFNLLHDAFDKDEKRQILRKYYTGTNQEVISLLNQ
jgi:hypothetical protein